MIISASRRTDIPAFYSEWLMNRNPAQVREVSLHPGDVECFVFWTKDPFPMLNKLEELDKMGYAHTISSSR